MLQSREQVQALAAAVHESNLNIYAEMKSHFDSFKNFQDGLNMNEVEASRREFGANVLPQVPAKSFLAFVLEAAQDKILILLSIAAIVSLTIHWEGGGWIEGVAILAAVLIVILVNALNDWKKDRLFRALNNQSQSTIKAKVMRNRVQQQILLSKLVIGDIILLEPGVSCILILTKFSLERL
jgi:magnesium-transporting ATPase (P-type)